jgi:hypothetical protein
MRRRGSVRSGGLRAGLTAVAVLTGLLVGLASAPAWAHEGEESTPAHELVLQALAYMLNTPGDLESIEDKVRDAQESEDPGGVKMALVRQAEGALAADDMTGARDLLQRSIGARADLTGTDVQPILQTSPGQRSVTLATGGEAGTRVVADEQPGREGLTGGDAAVLVAAGVIAAGGILLSIRYRPAHSVHALRATAARRKDGE